jgi:hypothetical protein
MPPPDASPTHPEHSIIEPDLLLTAALDALAGLATPRGHFHASRRGVRCPAACQSARQVLALAGRLPFRTLTITERAAVLLEEMGVVRRSVAALAQTMCPPSR